MGLSFLAIVACSCLSATSFLGAEGKGVAKYRGTSRLMMIEPNNALADVFFKKRVEKELTQAFRYWFPQVQIKVKVENSTDSNFDYVITAANNDVDVVTENSLVEGYTRAILQNDSKIINSQLFGPTSIKDFNECDTGNVCGFAARCRNTQGSYTCQCKQGYANDGKGGCNDVNECESSSACREDQVCYNERGSYSCACKMGFRANQDGSACLDFDECVHGRHDCRPESDCFNTHGGYDCKCRSGYITVPFFDETFCVDLNECASSPCNPSAICKNTKGSFRCTCPGSDVDISPITECSVKSDECKRKNLCHKDAVCIDTDYSYRCQCKDGFYGDGVACKRSNGCEGIRGLTCHENAFCLSSDGKSECSCNEGFQGNGVTCSDVDECKNQALSQCGEGGTCKNTAGSYICTCKNGFEETDDGGCVDIDECWLSEDECVVNSLCENLPGSYSCSCAAGYSGDGRKSCEIIDAYGRSNLGGKPKRTPCDPLLGTFGSSVTCGANARCERSTLRMYSCKCTPGFIGKAVKSCYDMDECTEGMHSCNAAAHCNNTEGSYTCDCMRGYYGDGRDCDDMNECELSLHTCHTNATCINTRGSYSCECGVGFCGDGRICHKLHLYIGVVLLNSSFIYTPALSDSSSLEYRTLSDTVSHHLFQLYAWDLNNVYDVAVTSFLEGSAFVEHVIATAGDAAPALMRSMRIALADKVSATVQNPPVVLNEVDPWLLEDLLSDVSATGILARKPLRPRAMKMFSSVIHLRPSIISEYEDTLGGSVLDPISKVHAEFTAKLKRELTRVHSFGNSYVNDIAITAIQPARTFLLEMKDAMDQSANFFKASVLVEGNLDLAMMRGPYFHHLLTSVVSKLTRSYGFHLAKNTTIVQEHQTLEDLKFGENDIVLVGFLEARAPTRRELGTTSEDNSSKIVVDHLIVLREDYALVNGQIEILDINYLKNSFAASKKWNGLEYDPWDFTVVPQEAGAKLYFTSVLQQWDITSLDVVDEDLLLSRYDIIVEGRDDVFDLGEMDLLNTFMNAYTPGAGESKKFAFVGTPKRIGLEWSVTQYPNSRRKVFPEEKTIGTTGEVSYVNFTASIYVSPRADPMDLINLVSENPGQQEVADVFSPSLMSAYEFGLYKLSDAEEWSVENVMVDITGVRNMGFPGAMLSGIVILDFTASVTVRGDDEKITRQLLNEAFEVAENNRLFDNNLFTGVPWNLEMTRGTTTTTKSTPSKVTTGALFGTTKMTTNSPSDTRGTTTPEYRTTGYSGKTTVTTPYARTTVSPEETVMTTRPPRTTVSPRTTTPRRTTSAAQYTTQTVTASPSIDQSKALSSAFALLMQASRMDQLTIQRRVENLSTYARSVLRIILRSPDTPFVIGTRTIMYLNAALADFSQFS